MAISSCLSRSHAFEERPDCVIEGFGRLDVGHVPQPGRTTSVECGIMLCISRPTEKGDRWSASP